MKSILITGGARAGKSRFAQSLAEVSGETVLFVATAEAGDDDMRQRIAEHRRQRPTGWRTLETPTNLGIRIREEAGDARVVVIDCLTMLVNNIFGRYCDASGEPTDLAAIQKEVALEAAGLIQCFKAMDATFIIVTNEVGLGLVPANRLGRLYRDSLGKMNQLIAAEADEVYLMVAGLPVRIKPQQ